MSNHKSKLSKSLVCKFLEISINPKKYDQPSSSFVEALEELKDGNARRAEKKLSRKRLRRPKSRKCTISILAGCGCQSGRHIVIDRVSADASRMPEVCSVQSIPSCGSSSETKEEKCPEWISSASFDEMLKLSTSHDNRQVLYNFESNVEKNALELHILPLKFTDLVGKIRRTEQIISTSKKLDQKFDRKILPVAQLAVSPKLSSLRRPLGKNVNENSATLMTNTTVQFHSNVEMSMISKRKDSRLTDCLLIMKSSCDPRREFKDSMMEMIVENDIKDGRDMEELLSCFLYLNSEDYHDVIIQVFKQIWAELIQIQKNH